MSRVVVLDFSDYVVDLVVPFINAVDAAGYVTLAQNIREQVESDKTPIVLDLGDRQRREYVVEILREARHSWTNAVADAIEAQTKPVKTRSM